MSFNKLLSDITLIKNLDYFSGSHVLVSYQYINSLGTHTDTFIQELFNKKLNSRKTKIILKCDKSDILELGVKDFIKFVRIQ